MRKPRLRSFSLVGRLASVYDWGRQEDLGSKKYYVRGKRASLNEYNVAKALDTLGLEFIFQVSLLGGRVPFGIVLDFLVETVPYITPMWVHGEHWHTGAQREIDLLQQAVIEDYLGTEVARPVELWGDQTDTEEKALMYTRMALGFTT